MSVTRRELPIVARGVDVSKLNQANLKLYSDEQIAEIKKHLTSNGRYREYQKEDGSMVKMEHPVFVFNGRYFAGYSGKHLRYDDSFIAKSVKVAQDLDSGEWVIDKVVSNVDAYDKADIDNEVSRLQDVQRAVVAEGEPVTLQNTNTNKQYLFMKYNSGLNMLNWINKPGEIPMIVKMDMAAGFVDAVMDLHQQGILHRDLKPSNIIFNMFMAFNRSVALVDFGLSQPMGDTQSVMMPAGSGTEGYIAPEADYMLDNKETGVYSPKSEVYALGVSLGQLFDLIDMKDVSGYVDFKMPVMKEGAKGELAKLITQAIDHNPENRPELSEFWLKILQLRESLDDNECAVRVLLLDTSLFLQKWQDRNEYAQLCTDLKDFHQIRLVDTSGTKTDAELLHIKFLLENAGFIVSNEVLLESPQMMLQNTTISNSVRGDDRRIYHYTCYGELPTEPEQRPIAHEVSERMRMRDEDHADQVVETYNWMDCIGWFVGSLLRDLDRALQIEAAQPADQNPRRRDEDEVMYPGCFGLFSFNPLLTQHTQRNIREADMLDDRQNDIRTRFQ